MNSGWNIGWEAPIHISPLGHSTFKTEGAGVENGVHDTVAVALADFENEAYIVL